MSTQNIEHDYDRHRFTLATGGEMAVLEYHVKSHSADEPTAIDFTRTYVPVEFRGKGLAESLVRHGLRWAREQHYDISASCWYVAKFLR